MKSCKLGTDSHADQSCIGRHAWILSVIDGRICTAGPFNDLYTPTRNIETVNVAFVTETLKGETIILVINQALEFLHSMDHSILCSNFVRINMW